MEQKFDSIITPDPNNDMPCVLDLLEQKTENSKPSSKHKTPINYQASYLLEDLSKLGLSHSIEIYNDNAHKFEPLNPTMNFKDKTLKIKGDDNVSKLVTYLINEGYSPFKINYYDYDNDRWSTFTKDTKIPKAKNLEIQINEDVEVILKIPRSIFNQTPDKICTLKEPIQKTLTSEHESSKRSLKSKDNYDILKEDILEKLKNAKEDKETSDRSKKLNDLLSDLETNLKLMPNENKHQFFTAYKEEFKEKIKKALPSLDFSTREYLINWAKNILNTIIATINFVFGSNFGLFNSQDKFTNELAKVSNLQNEIVQAMDNHKVS